MTSYLQIKNWDKFQQYKDRDPKWIKLHRGLLRDYEFGRLPDNQKACLLMIWLLGAETDNKIPNDPDWIMKQAQLKAKPDINQLVTLGFLDAYESVQNCTQSLYIETETETETETDVFDSHFWERFPRQRRGDKENTRKAWKAALKKSTAKEILDGLEAYIGSTEVRDGFAKGAAAWLNASKWTDVYTTRTQAGKPSSEPRKSSVMVL